MSQLGRFSAARLRASAKISLPSASVLSTCTLFPDRVTMMSVVLYAVDEMAFSQSGTMTVRLMSSLASRMAHAAQKAAAAPPMSYFMPIWASAGFRQ